MNQQRLKYLFGKYFDKTADDAERNELMRLLLHLRDEEIGALLEKAFHNYDVDDEVFDLSTRERLLTNILGGHSVDKEKRVHRLSGIRKKIKYAAAAVVLVGLSIGAYFYSMNPHLPTFSRQQYEDLKPGGNKAILTLADGNKIILNDKGLGTIAEEENITITKTADGQLLYTIKDSATKQQSDERNYNVISTPRGGQYQVILPDGTNVWLNASSSLKYPVRFGGKERVVVFEGEGYFEVATDKTRPFKVNTPKESVEVLGTHFNINSYADEPLSKTTLVEGKVRVSEPGAVGQASHRVLLPGQQSVVRDGNLEVTSVNIQNVIAWKNGEFMFNIENIETVMRTIARWYDVDIIYQSPVEQAYIWGSVSRFENISEVLKVIEMTGTVHFKVEGRRVYVSSN